MGVRGGDIWRRMGFIRITFLRWRSLRRRWRRRRRLRRLRNLRVEQKRKADSLRGMRSEGKSKSKGEGKSKSKRKAGPPPSAKDDNLKTRAKMRGSVLAVAAFDAFEEFGGVVAYAVFEDDFYFFYVVDVGGGVAVDDDQVCVFAWGDGADGGLFAHVGGSVEGADLDGFDGCEAVGIHEEF